MPFIKASKKAAKLRLALIGPSGSGKTMTALRIAKGLGGRIALVDTERGSASKYSDVVEFDVLELDSFHPQRYIDAIHEAEAAGYDILIVDSLSHSWMGKDGALELVDRAAKRQGGNKFTAWGDVTPLQQQLVDAMIGAKLHLIATVRSKMEYVQEKDGNNKTVIRKVGMQPVQRDGLEYEFDLVGDMDQSNTLVVSKSRCQALTGAVIDKPGAEVAATLKAWLTDGSPVADPPKPQPTQTNGAAPKASTEPSAIERAFPAGETATPRAPAEPDVTIQYQYDGETYDVPGRVSTLSVPEVGAYLGYRAAIRNAKTLEQLGQAFATVNLANKQHTVHPDVLAALVADKDKRKGEIAKAEKEDPF